MKTLKQLKEELWNDGLEESSKQLINDYGLELNGLSLEEKFDLIMKTIEKIDSDNMENMHYDIGYYRGYEHALQNK